VPLIHAVAATVCVAAAALHLALVRDRTSRVGHAVMLAAMVALALGMASWPVVVACVLALAALGGRLLLAAEGSARSCALDAIACAGLAVLAWLAMPGAGDHESMHAMADMASTGTSYAGRPLLLAVAVGAAWAVIIRLTDRSRTSLGHAASGLMVGGMALMALA
jgi:hypothetical protein